MIKFIYTKDKGGMFMKSSKFKIRSIIAAFVVTSFLSSFYPFENSNAYADEYDTSYNDNIEYNILQQSNNHIKLGGIIYEKEEVVFSCCCCRNAAVGASARHSSGGRCDAGRSS